MSPVINAGITGDMNFVIELIFIELNVTWPDPAGQEGSSF